MSKSFMPVEVEFKTAGQPFGDTISVQRKYAFFPKKLLNGWTWRNAYYEVTRHNAYVPHQFEHHYTETLFLSKEDYLVFTLKYQS